MPRRGTVPSRSQALVVPLSKQSRNDDGGYDAIKGFAYQFDATLLEIFANPRASYEVEGAQDLSSENYYIQVKNRSGNFYLSSIARAVSQMFRQFLSHDAETTYLLHCHFADRTPGMTRSLTLDELESIIPQDLALVSLEDRERFIKAFSINFSNDYDSQFRCVLRQIATELSTRDQLESISYHAILHAYLRNLVLTKPPGARRVNLGELKKAVRASRSAIFASTYADHCGYDKYLKMVRRQYLPKRVNVHNFERIFSFELDESTDPEEIAIAALAIRERYLVAENSPPPYVTFRGIFDGDAVRAALWDAGAYFNDGCGWHAGRFNLDFLVDPPVGSFGLKIVDQSMIPDLLAKIQVKEFHDFFAFERCSTPGEIPRPRHVFLRSYSDLDEVLK